MDLKAYSGDIESPLEAAERESIEQSSGPKGLYGQFMYERIPEYDKAGSENIMQGNNNSFIVLGRDRAGNPADGFGGRGATSCGMIDLIAGLDGADNQKAYSADVIDPEASQENREEYAGRQRGQQAASPSFFHDAARVYLTQKGAIDKYLGLAQGSERLDMSNGKSAVGIKADHVRIVGRQHIKIVTGKQRLTGTGMYGERDSKGGKTEYTGGIDLIAGNYTDDEIYSLIDIFKGFFGEDRVVQGKQRLKKLQPLVKGENLILFFRELFDFLMDICARVEENTDYIQELASTFAGHSHVSPFMGIPTTIPRGAAKAALTKIKAVKTQSFTRVMQHNLNTMEANYLEPLLPTYINSRYVKTT